MTNRILVTFAIVLIFSISANAQFHIGVKAGVNAGKIDGKSFKQEFNYNYLVGGFAEIGLGNRWSLNPEVLFSQTTTTTDASFTNTLPSFNNDQIKATLDYLSIPILLNFRLIGPLHLEAGPQFGVLLNKEKKLLQNGEEAFKKGDFSLAGGAGINLNMFRVSARYVMGLSDIRDVAVQDKWKSQAIQLSVGLAF